jgi:hypothetical protein
MTIPICALRECKLFSGISKTGKYNCIAFPNGIPDDILSGQNLHLENIEGDGGYKFETNKQPYDIENFVTKELNNLLTKTS